MWNWIKRFFCGQEPITVIVTPVIEPKAPANKPAAKKPAVKKPAVKKPVVKKPAAKKPVVKKAK